VQHNHLTDSKQSFRKRERNREKQFLSQSADFRAPLGGPKEGNLLTTNKWLKVCKSISLSGNKGGGERERERERERET
jgi:hypothetical protein